MAKFRLIFGEMAESGVTEPVAAKALSLFPVAEWAEPNEAKVESFLLWAEQHTVFFILIHTTAVLF